jgi:hypothetical protein
MRRGGIPPPWLATVYATTGANSDADGVVRAARANPLPRSAALAVEAPHAGAARRDVEEHEAVDDGELAPFWTGSSALNPCAIQ